MIKLLHLLSIFIFVLQGCSNTYEKVIEDSKNNTEIATRLNQKLDDGEPNSSINYEKFITEKFFVSPIPIIQKKNKSHEKLLREYTVNEISVLSISQITQELSILTGIKFRLAPEIIDGIDTVEEIRPQWIETKLQDILNQIESQLSFSWEFIEKNNTIDIYRYKTKNYTIHVPTESESHSTEMSNASLSGGSSDGSSAGGSSGGGGGGGGSSISTSLSLENDFWGNIEESIAATLSAEGRFSVHPDTFTVYVTDTELVHERIENLIENINTEQLKQVVFNIDIYRLSSNDSDIYGLNYEAIYKGAEASINFTTPRAAVAGLSNLVLGKSGGSFAGSQFFLDALSKYGAAERLDHYKRVTLNNRLAPVTIFRNTPYLGSVNTVLDQGQSSTGAALRDLITGFSLTLRPHIINKNEVLLTLATDRKSAGEAEVIAVSQNLALQKIDTEGDSFYSQSIVKNNQTMVLTGYVSNNDNATSSGIGKSSAWWAGGRREATRAYSIIVITVNVVII